MTDIFEKIPNSSLREQITAKIKAAILSGDLREGDRLVERNLAAQFATSLTAVRESLVQLEAEGFVTKKANSATHISKFSLDQAEKIAKVRRVLETFAVEEAARCASQAQIRELEESYSELLKAARKEAVQEYQLKDFALHEKLWELTGNEYLQAALRRIVFPMFATSSIRLVSCPPFDLIQDAHSHLAIVKAIKQKDPKGARKAFVAGLDRWFDEQMAMIREKIQKEEVSSMSH